MKHMRNINLAYKCSKCGAGYKNSTDRNTHEKTCGNEPHLKCPFCELKTKYSSNLHKHIRRKHQTFSP